MANGSLSLARCLHAILRPALLAALDAEAVERPADDMVTHARQVTHTATADEHDRVLLEVVALAADVGGDFLAVRKPHAADLAERGIGLLRGNGLDLETHAALLRAGLEVLHLALV